MRRALTAIAATAAMLIGTLAAAPPALAESAGFVYSTHTHLTCGHPSCGGTGMLPPWMKSLTNPFFATTDGNGRFYHRATLILVGRPGHPRRCDATVFSQPFSGRCVIQDFGVGRIRRSEASGPLRGERTFWVYGETASFDGGTLHADPFAPYPLDTLTPWKPGHYTTEDLLGSSPPGVTAVADIERTPRSS